MTDAPANSYPDTGPAQDVFLSYSRPDKARAARIKAALEAAGISVWWDDMLEGGTRFLKVTEFHLENAAAVVVVWSRTSIASHWVSDEATRGRDRGVLVPVTIDGSMPPLGFRQFQVLDLSASEGATLAAETQKLIDTVRSRKAARDGRGADAPQAAVRSPGSMPGAASGPVPVSRPLATRRGAIITGGAALVGLAGLGVWQSGMLGEGAATTKRLAVMPFEVIGGEAGKAAILAGIAHEVRTRLSRNPLLHVAAETSSRALADAGKTAGEICDELKVDYLLTGSVSLVGDRLDVSGELVEGRTERAVLPIGQTGPVGSVLTLQSEIASAVIRELTSADEEEDTAKSGGTQDVAAYDAFLQGRELYTSGLSEETDRGALAKFDEAIALDPAYAAAHAMRGRTLALIANLYGAPGEIGALYEEAVQSAREATRRAPQFAGGYGVLGDIHANRQLDMKAAREPFEMSIRLGQGDADILSRYAVFEARIGAFAEARKAITSALALDPLNAGAFRFAGRIEYDSGAYAAALRRFEDALTIQQDMAYANYLVGITQLALGDNAAAKAAFEAETRFVWRKTGLAIAEHRLGNTAAAQTHFAELKQQQGNKSHYQYMQIHAQWGEVDAALDAMDAAWAARDSGLVEARNDPLLDPLRENPRFAAMLAQIGFV